MWPAGRGSESPGVQDIKKYEKKYIKSFIISRKHTNKVTNLNYG